MKKMKVKCIRNFSLFGNVCFTKDTEYKAKLVNEPVYGKCWYALDNTGQEHTISKGPLDSWFKNHFVVC